MSSIQQVILLAGGKGTRMREMTEDLPKPMVEIGGIPVLEHLINIFEVSFKKKPQNNIPVFRGNHQRSVNIAPL